MSHVVRPSFYNKSNTAQKMDAISELKDILTKFSGSTCAAENKSPLKHSQQIQELVKLSSHIFKDQQTISAIFAPIFRTPLGYLVSILLDAFKNSKIDKIYRFKSGEMLCSITNPDYRMISADFIAFILPGVFAVCQKLLLEKLTQMHSLENVKCASKLLTNVISTAFSEINSTEIRIIDQRKEENATPSNAILDFKRDENWMKMAKQKIVHQLGFTLSRLSAHETDYVRLEAVQILAILYEQGIFGEDFDKIALDVIYCLYSDESPMTQKSCRGLLQKIRSKGFVEAYAIKKLTKALKTLEIDIKNSSDGRRHFDNFTNLLEIMGPAILNRLFLCDDFIGHFLDPVLAVIVLDKGKQLLSSSMAERCAIPLPLPPLKYGLCAQGVIKLVQLLVDLANFESLFDWLLNEFDSEVEFNQRKLSIALFFYFMTKTNFAESWLEDSATSKMLASNMINMLKGMDSLLEEEVYDHQVESNFPKRSSTIESCLVQLLLSCFASLHFYHQIEAKLRTDLLYEVLKWSSSSNYAIREAADNCLTQISQASISNPSSSNESSISDFIFSNVHGLAFKISLASRDFSLNPRFPWVLAEMVNRCQNPAMYAEVRGVFDEVLYWLDYSDQCRTLLLLRALRDYVRALLKWFPNFAPSSSGAEQERAEEKEDSKIENEDANYSLIQNGITILSRTKHFISSPNLPIQLLVLDILHSSLQFVRNYENQLLPMIHQNWDGLIQKLAANGTSTFPDIFIDSQKLVAIKALDVIETMCQLSKDFIYWKIVNDFLPRIVILLEKLCPEISVKHNDSLQRRRQSVAYKLQFSLFDRIPAIIRESQVIATPKHLDALKETLISCNQRILEEELRHKAKEALQKLE